MNISAGDVIAPEKTLPNYQPTEDDCALSEVVCNLLRNAEKTSHVVAELDLLYEKSSFPKYAERIVLVMYAPGHKRIVVSRSGIKKERKFSSLFQALFDHPRSSALALGDFRLQLDFILVPPVPVDFYSIGMEETGDRHFEIGLDGLIITGIDGALYIFLPGDCYVRSIMGMEQLRDYLHKSHSENYLRQAKFSRFCSESYISTNNSWRYLYRGHPIVGELTKEKIRHALELAIGHIKLTQEADGKFLYYYDAATDSRRDHEHPNRDPKNLYYNILRHCGGALTCVYYEKFARSGGSLVNVQRAIDYLVAQARIQYYDGKEGAYIFSEKKSKLGGTGIALYLLADYQLLTGDDSYRVWADRFAWHLLNQITSSGEFIYYNIYLDKIVTEAENQNYFSFYYPGEAICGLAKYLHLLDNAGRSVFFDRLKKALEFLLLVRPTTRASEYIDPPSDGWLMMGIMELWDFEQMRDSKYADFVFSDAQKMIDHMYKVTDAPYGDYAGAFYYRFGDYPYADGARCEGLLGAYELALKMGATDKTQRLWPALRLSAWTLLHLVNTEESVYSAKNPRIALGGIRFKYTRQWFRIDTIQHVASYFAKLLPHWNMETQKGNGDFTKSGGLNS